MMKNTWGFLNNFGAKLIFINNDIQIAKHYYDIMTDDPSHDAYMAMCCIDHISHF